MREDIHNLVFNQIAPKYLDVTNLSSAGILKSILEIVAECASIEKDHQDNIMLNAFVQTATGSYLDYLCGSLSLTRKRETKTIGNVIFGRNGSMTSNVAIKKGSIVKSKMNSFGKEYRYFVVEDTVLAENQSEVSVKVEAENYGSNYNVLASYITRIVTPISGVDYITNNTDWILQAGTDQETDESLRQRYFDKWGELTTGANEKAYQSWAKSVSSVSDAIVAPTPRGNYTVDVIILTNSGLPSQQIIDEVKSVIEENRPIGVDVQVKAPLEINVNIDIILHILPQYSLMQNIIEQRTNEIINALFIKNINNVAVFKIGEDFVIDKVKQQILNNTEGIKYIEFISPTNNLVCSYDSIIKKGTVNINSVIESEI
ncbi:MAG TPA: baseplate J/gp47 family protein [Spirochaetota bacterium]|nr:baseplate J/gp47 family protein [Spirochaetota bacterium]